MRTSSAESETHSKAESRDVPDVTGWTSQAVLCQTFLCMVVSAATMTWILSEYVHVLN